MNCNNILYIIASYACNLHCPYCSIRLQNCQTNLEKIKQQILNSNFDEYVLFGGEPLLLDATIFNELLATDKITSISTNLLLMTDDIADRLINADIAIATSWNPDRFTDEQYRLWHDKLCILDRKNIKTTILITLTNNLIQKSAVDIYKNIIEDICSHQSVTTIKFEQLVANDIQQQYYLKCDEWLCEMHKIWKVDAVNSLSKSLKYKYNIHQCHNVYTITPDAKIHNGCPMALCYKTYKFLSECVDCEYNKICQPCVLQKYCSFPKKLYALIQKK